MFILFYSNSVLRVNVCFRCLRQSLISSAVSQAICWEEPPLCQVECKTLHESINQSLLVTSWCCRLWQVMRTHHMLIPASVNCSSSIHHHVMITRPCHRLQRLDTSTGVSVQTDLTSSVSSSTFSTFTLSK